VRTRIVKYRRIGKGTYYHSSWSPGEYLLWLVLGPILLIALIVTLVGSFVTWAVAFARDYPVVPILIGVGVAAAGVRAVQGRKRRRLAESAEEERRLREEAEAAAREDAIRVESRVGEVRSLVQQMIERKSPSARRFAAERALLALAEAETMPGLREAFKDLTRTRALLVAVERGAIVADLLGKAGKNRFMEKAARERDCLLRALYEIRESGLTDADLSLLVDVGADHHYPTMQEIDRRARELGWNGEAIRSNGTEHSEFEDA
jgi:membrane protein implicated in regulation of membrane protease activity